MPHNKPKKTKNITKGRRLTTYKDVTETKIFI